MIEDDRNKAPAERDPDGEAVAQAWRRLPADEPPELLDQAVLNRARRDLESTRPRPLRWLGHFATASVAVIALSVWLLHDRGPAAPGGDATLRVAPPAAESAADSPPPSAAPQAQGRRLAPSALSAPAPAAAANADRAKGAPARAETRPAKPAEFAPAADEALEETTQPRTPDDWIEHMLALQAAGRHAELQAELAAFRAAWPDYPLPAALAGE